MSRPACRLRALWVASFAAWILAADSSAGAGAGSAKVAGAPAARQGVLVELFTSQGCSSCPPADRFLSELAAREDIDVIPLSFHVDYWNYIGWTDPFSSPAWSERQRRYARVFGGNRIYTPQIVVGGRWEGVGSQRKEILDLIERAHRQGPIEIGLIARRTSEKQVRVSVEARGAQAPPAAEPLAIWVALVESDLSTAVGRGENAAKTLRNDRVVRHLDRISRLERVANDAVAGSLVLPVEEGWRRDRLSVVAFVQDEQTLRVAAAAEVTLTR